MRHQIKHKFGIGFLTAAGLLAGTFSTALAERIEEDRSLSGFSKIALNGSMDMEIEVGPDFKVIVSADDRIIDRIETEVRGSTLYVGRERGSRRGFRNARILVTVTLPSMEGFSTNGSGDAWIEGVSAGNFEFDQNGSGDTEISGTCTDGEFEMNGSGDLDARDFSCTNAGIDTNGSGDITLNVTGEVSIDSRGSGDVTLYGEPSIKKLRTRGSGDLDIR